MRCAFSTFSRDISFLFVLNTIFSITVEVLDGIHSMQSLYQLQAVCKRGAFAWRVEIRKEKRIQIFFLLVFAFVRLNILYVL